MDGLNKGLRKVEIAVRWDPSPAGQPSTDLDLVAATYPADDPHGDPAYVVHFDSRSPDGTIYLNRDSKDGQGFGYDEVMTLELDRLDGRYARVVVGVVIQQRPAERTFVSVVNPGLRIREGYTVLAEDAFGSVLGATAATVAEFVRDGSGPWDFRPGLRGFEGDPVDFARRWVPHTGRERVRRELALPGVNSVFPDGWDCEPGWSTAAGSNAVPAARTWSGNSGRRPACCHGSRRACRSLCRCPTSWRTIRSSCGTPWPRANPWQSRTPPRGAPWACSCGHCTGRTPKRPCDAACRPRGKCSGNAPPWRTISGLACCPSCRLTVAPRLRPAEGGRHAARRGPRPRDLGPGHLLAQDGALTGVIDFGDAHIGDPAVDLAWALNGTSPAFAEACSGHRGT